MRVKFTYYADDGKEFETEEECRAYEREKEVSFDAVMFFDENLEWHRKPDIPFIESDMVYLKVLDVEKAEELFDWLDELCGVFLPREFKEGHIYGYDYNDDDWVDVTERYRELQAIVQKVEGELYIGSDDREKTIVAWNKREKE